MKLKVLGSSSQGNCYILEAEKETLVLEAGIRFSDIVRGLNYELNNVIGCIVSHSHGDHSLSINKFVDNCIPVAAPKETLDKFNVKGSELKHKQTIKFGEFSILPLEVKHDVPTMSFVITHEEMGTMLFCTDASSFPYKLSCVNHLLIEANFCYKIVEDNFANNPGSFNPIERLEESHMSIDETINVINRHKSCLSNVVLIHLSDRNSNAKEFKSKAQAACGKPVYIAEPNLTINL